LNEELKVVIKAETADFKKEVDESKKEIKKFKDQVKDAGKNIDESMKKAGEGAAKGARALAVGAVAAGAAVVALISNTKEYRQSQNQLASAFEVAGGSAEEAKQTYDDLYRVLGDAGQATEAALHLAKLTTNEKELAEWTTACQGIYATFGASLPIESLTEAANETAKVGTVTGALADALNWAGYSEDDFNASLAECNTEAEREALIRTTLNDIYGDAAAKYEENNASVLAQNEAQMRLDESLAQLAATLAPVVATLTEFAANVLSKIAPYLQDALKWVNEHKVVLGVVAGVIGSVVAAIGLYNAVTAVKAAMDAAQVTTIGALISAHAAQAVAAMAALAPYLAIVAAITAVIAIIVLCIKHWDDIVAAVKKAMAKIKEWVQIGVEAIRNAFSKVTDFLAAPIEKAKEKIRKIIDTIKGFFKFNWELPKLKVPKFSISPSGWKIGDLLEGVIPKLSIKWNARGGVFERPTLTTYGGSLQGLGEAGAEAIVPLENNLKWLDKLAGMLNERMGGSRPIVLKVGEKVLAETTFSAWNNYVTQTGSCPVKVW
jgi:2-hydroxy-3-keto-5-methylthiopentenyl-1-phosphate phosphatase